MSDRVGPFVFEFLPDGDDPRTGIVRLTTDSGYQGETALGVTLVEYRRFRRTLAKSSDTERKVEPS